ncbi:hypothetical protein ISG33_01985 [Glaciecola sp. MH2013]|uniref:RIFT barrel domain-containing protein n=1 Tax=Glaciecola sp. MH2013 TaxID=2785524 RepID=UPI0018A0580D|nr:hypothetical protein [Glaciecola sp. MH2013]MBF7072171.1 hypothetical protein [Glaciecola sp. MH2013]
MTHVFSLQAACAGSQAFSVGVPLPKGQFFLGQSFGLITQSGEEVAAQISVKSLWQDKSVRWCLIKGYSETSHFDDQSKLADYYLNTRKANTTRKINCALVHDQHILLKSAKVELAVSSTQFLNIRQHTNSKQGLHIRPLLSFSNNQYTSQLTHSQQLTRHSASGQALFSELEQTFSVGDKYSSKSLNIELKFVLDHAHNTLDINLTAHNPQAIVQKGGQWDLGNENSLHLREFGLVIEMPNASLYCSSERSNTTELKAFDYWNLSTDNSGGDNWQSKNHVNHEGKVDIGERGALLIERANDSTHSYRLDRPNPLIYLKNRQQTLEVAIEKLWQKFPIQIRAGEGELSINFAGANESAAVELQPGEKKSHKLRLCFDSTAFENKDNENKASDQAISEQEDHVANASAREVTVKPNTELFSDSNAIPWLKTPETGSALANIIELGLSGKQHFFAKREALDEYGWRNFGDLYADHEAANHSGDDIFVSHYNNQYDPLFGFLKQWLLSGNDNWKTLADDLYDHIVNIDIYHTEQDKKEYNGGLFWHTDHYVEAETATHRTYSKRQQTGVYEDHAGGGGPGSHHCYTSGLALYYHLSGCEKAKAAVLQLTTWISYFFEGDGTVLGTLLQYRNKAIVRNPLNGKYPLDRGVANYVNALLDSFDVSANKEYMENASSVILNTFSADDDIADRNFGDIENTWYYIVFMQSVAKFLWRCESDYGISQDYFNIKRAFMHYASYIAKHEQVYLHNSDKLEYPNDTWTAQDLRKVQVLKVAIGYAENDELREQMQDKINEIQRFVEKKLSQSEEKEYTRILALLMQNANDDFHLYHQHVESANIGEPTLSLSYQTKAFSPVLAAWHFLKQYSIRREFKHLFIRFPQLRGK